MTSLNPISARYRLVLVTVAMLLGCFDLTIASAFASSTMLEVGAAGGLPGFQEGELQLYLARHMTNAGLTEWRYEPALGEGLPANYVQWRFRLKPYNGGEVYSHHPFHSSRETFGTLYSVTLEARLYLNGEYQTLVEGQALMDGPNDPRLALAVTNLTRNLLGPSGAYHRIGGEPHRARPGALASLTHPSRSSKSITRYQSSRP